jgi:hypothetical protein
MRAFFLGVGHLPSVRRATARFPLTARKTTGPCAHGGTALRFLVEKRIEIRRAASP